MQALKFSIAIVEEDEGVRLGICTLLQKLGKQSEFIQGMRVTDEETLDVVEMVLGGLINQEIVTLINKAGGKAVGLTGKDGHFIHARKLKVASKEDKRKKIDVGRAPMIHTLRGAGYVIKPAA